MDLSGLLSGTVGALGVLLLTILYDRIKTALDRRRERKGLLRIVDAEVYENGRLLKDMIGDPGLSEKYPSRAALSADGWDQSRGRLSELLKNRDHIFYLVRHYASVRRIGALLTDPDAPISSRSKRDQRTKAANIREKRRILLSRLTNLTYLDGEQVRQKGKKYIGTLPDYYEKAGREAGEDDATQPPERSEDRQ